MTPAARHMDRVHRAGCVVCRRLGLGFVPPEIHHIAEGTAKRSDFATVGLCGDQYADHHDGRDTGGAGFHRLGTERFCKLYRVPWEREEGLLVWVNEDIARYVVGVAA